MVKLSRKKINCNILSKFTISKRASVVEERKYLGFISRVINPKINEFGFLIQEVVIFSTRFYKILSSCLVLRRFA